MIFTRIIQAAIVGSVILLIVLIKTWPLPLEPNVLGSLKIYSAYILRKQVRISDLLGSVDVACAVGPFDSFRDSRFLMMITEQQIDAAENALAKQNEISLGDNQFFLVGLRGSKVAAIYVSNLFLSLKPLEKETSTVLNCVSGGGFIIPIPERFGNGISIKLKEGA
jgi:hypothetical protein